MQCFRSMDDLSSRKWIWAAVVLQAIGYSIDVAWHALVHPEAEPATVPEMARHLATVHLPLYIGAVCVLLATGIALFRRERRSPGSAAARAAFAGALLSAGAELWHAYSHLRLDTAHAFLPGILSVVGFLIVVVSLSITSWADRRRRGAAPDRRAARW